MPARFLPGGFSILMSLFSVQYSDPFSFSASCRYVAFRFAAVVMLAGTLVPAVAQGAAPADGSEAPASQAPAAQAQSSSSAPAGDAPRAQAPNQSGTSVQARIRARREARRAAAINDVYSHLYEIYIGAGYLRFHPGPSAVNGRGLQRVNEYEWDMGVTRYYNRNFGVTIDARGIYGTAYVGPNAVTNSAITQPAIDQYSGMIGPTWRFLMHPKYSLAGRLMGGVANGTFSTDTGSFKPTQLGLYPDGIGGVFSASLPAEYNVSPSLGVRVAPEYLLTTFGSSTQHNLGFTSGLVFRWGKQ